MSKRNTGNLFLSAAGLIALTATFASPAYAIKANDSSSDAADAAALSVERFRDIDPDRVAVPVASAQSTALGEAITLSEGSITIPSDQEYPLVLTAPSGDSLEISLPANDVLGPTVQLSDGSAVLPGEDSSTTVIPGDSSVQLISTIENANAPTRYEYGLSLREGQSLQLIDGSPSVINADQSLEYVVADSWAKDATGANVSSRYEIEGSTLVQVVQHDVAGTTYPVVADPIFIPFWVYKCLLGLGLKGPDIVNAWATGTIWGGLGRAALACALGR